MALGGLTDDIEQWCGATVQELSHAALDRQQWAAIVRMASDTNGCWAHGCRWWWWWSHIGLCLKFLELMFYYIISLLFTRALPGWFGWFIGLLRWLVVPALLN